MRKTLSSLKQHFQVEKKVNLKGPCFLFLFPFPFLLSAPSQKWKINAFCLEKWGNCLIFCFMTQTYIFGCCAMISLCTFITHSYMYDIIPEFVMCVTHLMYKFSLSRWWFNGNWWVHCRLFLMLIFSKKSLCVHFFICKCSFSVI